MVETSMCLGKHLRMALPTGYLEDHLSHSPHRDAVAAGRKEQQLLLLTHRHLAEHLPEPAKKIIIHLVILCNLFDGIRCIEYKIKICTRVEYMHIFYTC